MFDLRPNNKIALMLAKRSLSELVCDAVNLDGINFTLPEVQTLLNGITVGGHKFHDQENVLTELKSWKKIFFDIENNHFEISKKYVCSLYNIISNRNISELSNFRTSQVSIIGTDYMPPMPHELDKCFDLMKKQANDIKDILNQSIFIFLEMSRNKFFKYDNKRISKFVMNGNLLQHGYPVINIPAKRQLEFNQKMLNFYETHNHQEMTEFMLSCIDGRVVEIMSD
ncbi:Fic family protein [Francisella philomiragia]|uniref:cell filamentation protein Fic n=1 Tax=Francisella philomiragia TaxID=28110 RepID=UPI00190705C9|nr:cell filamentation protein Fic [Francisella philomiragia]MBK2297340.1 cell filamentation protein Fic [Francisella philomiragia]